MNTNQKGFASVILILVLVVIVAGGLGYVALTQKPSAVVTPATTTEQTAVQTSQVPSNQKINIQVVSLASQNKNVLPVVHYRIYGSARGNGYIQLMDKKSGNSVWSMEQEVSGTYDLDLNTLTAINGSPVILAEGDYFLRISDKFADNTPGDALVACTKVTECQADSAVFHAAYGITQTFTNQTSVTVQRISWNIEKVNPAIVDDNDYRKYEQTISVDVTFADDTIKRYKLGTAYVCTSSNVESIQGGKKIFGKVDCFMSEVGATFVAYSQNGRFVIERQNENGKDGLLEPVVLIEI